jgi:MFS-type transporter involved in bile tolerance (Atg22 family)
MGLSEKEVCLITYAVKEKAQRKRKRILYKIFARVCVIFGIIMTFAMWTASDGAQVFLYLLIAVALWVNAFQLELNAREDDYLKIFYPAS